MKKYNVAVAGATGMVGRTFIEILEERNFPIAEIRLLASEKSAGTKLTFKNEEIPVEVLSNHSFKGIDIVLFSAGAGVSKRFSPVAAESGATVIDNSSAFRMEKDIPLVVPEVNAHALRSSSRIIANPNCSTIQMVVAVKPLHDIAKVKRIVVSTYQAVSGKGKNALTELMEQANAYATGEEMEASVFPYQIAFSALPHIDVFLEEGDTKEERKMVQETQKIMEAPEIQVSATCVRIGAFNGHAESVNLEFEKDLAPEEARRILSDAPGVIVLDDPANNIYPTQPDASGRDEVFVGRIRRDYSIAHGLNMWVVADNLRKGAALNAIQIAEELIKTWQ